MDLGNFLQGVCVKTAQALLPIARVARSYDAAFIRNNPIQTVCIKCKRREPINAPVIENVRCFWCGGKVIPTDIKSYRTRLAELPKYLLEEYFDE